MQTCRECSSRLSECPICRQRITSRLRLYTWRWPVQHEVWQQKSQGVNVITYTLPATKYLLSSLPCPVYVFFVKGCDTCTCVSQKRYQLEITKVKLCNWTCPVILCVHMVCFPLLKIVPYNDVAPKKCIWFHVFIFHFLAVIYEMCITLGLIQLIIWHNNLIWMNSKSWHNNLIWMNSQSDPKWIQISYPNNFQEPLLT